MMSAMKEKDKVLRMSAMKAKKPAIKECEASKEKMFYFTHKKNVLVGVYIEGAWCKTGPL